MKEKFAEQMERELQGRVVLSERQMEQFYRYCEMLTEWNKVMNLTAITEMEEVVTKHFVDSLSLGEAVPDLAGHGWRVMDVGTGAGFPGIPLKIAYPELKITLLDSLNKRIKFLDAVAEELQLEGVETIHGRAEDFGRDRRYREQYDLCVSRAVANLATLSEYCLPFVKVGGAFVSYKSGKLEEELESGRGEVSKLGSEIEKVLRFALPNGDERVLVTVKKMKPLSTKYPRKAGLPSKMPLA